MSKSYEIVRYAGMPFAQTHPDRLATTAWLFGMTPRPIHKARILEIGCCDGGNLIPMAMSQPGSEFVGIDLTAPDIELANALVEALGLSNIKFHAFDLNELPGAFGQFDYIIAHGLYSWIPAAIRENFLSRIQASLAPNGVAYVSYNVLPGGHMRMMIREMMLYHIRGVEDPAEKLTRCRQLLQFICEASGRDVEYQSFIRQETETIFSRPDYGLFHDELEENYHPVYFHEFAAHLERSGLQYLSEANYFDTCVEAVGGVDSPVFDEISGDRLLREQYLDFARCRRFRQTLVCHQDIKIDGKLQLERLNECFIACPATQVEPGEDSDPGVEEFHGPKQSKIKTAHPVVLRILHRIVDAWPNAIPFSDVAAGEGNLESVREIIHAMYSSGLIEIRMSPPVFALVPSDRPVASLLARWQAARGGPITTLRHAMIAANGEVERRLISLLDGTRTRQELFAELAPMLVTGKSEAELKAELESSLNTLGRLCLLTS